VEPRALVRKGRSRFGAFADLTRAESAEVLSCLGNNIIVELEGDTAGWLFANGDVEKDAGSGGSHFKGKRFRFKLESEWNSMNL
jgi:hypothetical protein